jgi:uncharacterized protein (TIGR00251 family)
LCIAVRVKPRAKCDEVAGVKDDRLQIRTTAPPANGKANKAAAALLADFLDVAPTKIELRRGRTHRDKQFLVKGIL